MLFGFNDHFTLFLTVCGLHLEGFYYSNWTTNDHNYYFTFFTLLLVLTFGFHRSYVHFRFTASL